MARHQIILTCFLIASATHQAASQAHVPQNRKESLQIANNFYQSGLELQRNGHFEASVAQFDSAIRYNPQSPDIFFSQGSSLESAGWHSKALYAYNRAISLRPSFEGAMFRKSVCLYQLRLYEDAIQQLTTLLAGDGSGEATNSVFYRSAPTGEVTISTDNQLHAEYFLYRALSYAALNNGEQAIADMDSAVHISQGASDYLINRGLIYQQMGNVKKASGDYQAALQKDPENQLALANLFTVDATLAKTYLRENAEVTGSIVVPELLAQLAFEAYQKERYGEAVSYYTRALQLKPGEADWMLNRALSFNKLGNLTRAESELLRVVRLNDYPRKALLHLANVLFLEEKFESAISFYNQFIAIEPGYGSAYYNRGLSFSKLGNTLQACRDLQMASVLGVEESGRPLELLCNN